MHQRAKNDWYGGYCVVKISTSYWHDANGAYSKKSIKVLKRKTNNFNLLIEDCNNAGAELILKNTVNLNIIDDGIYYFHAANISRDCETGIIDDYGYMLTPYIEV